MPQTMEIKDSNHKYDEYEKRRQELLERNRRMHSSNSCYNDLDKVIKKANKILSK